jgi:hypothetical protein
MPQLTFRVDEALAERVDRVVEAMRRHPNYKGLDLSRTNVIKLMIDRALLTLEPEYLGELAGYPLKSEIRDILDGEIGRITNLRDKFPANVMASIKRSRTGEPDDT